MQIKPYQSTSNPFKKIEARVDRGSVLQQSMPLYLIINRNPDIDVSGGKISPPNHQTPPLVKWANKNTE